MDKDGSLVKLVKDALQKNQFNIKLQAEKVSSENLNMRWIFLVLIVLPLWACSEKKEKVTENYSSETVEAAQEIYQAPVEDLTEDQLEEAQQQEVDAATSNCVGNCSGHQAGYEWAQENSISSESDCDGNSDSFNEGCVNYVEGGSGY